jgi:hypothetical protein
MVARVRILFRTSCKVTRAELKGQTYSDNLLGGVPVEI